MHLLTIESTCDETAAAVISGEGDVLGAALASQEELHRQFRGVVPELAARAHVERILPVIDQALRQAGLDSAAIDAIAVANAPGLAGSLLVGLTAAKMLSVAWGKPLLAVNHLHAHIYACRMAAGRDIYPCVGLVVSGGHTTLYDCAGPLELTTLGGTIDDAAGEAFDKVAAMVGLPYPGGPEVSRAAAGGDPARYAFPRSMIHEDHFNFSFSGLKTAVRYALVGPGKQDFSQLELTPTELADLCASFEQAVVDCLVAKSRKAVRHTGHGRLCVGGGVAANRRFREAMQQAADSDGFELLVAPPELCTDNAVMGAIALEKLRRGDYADLELDIEAGLVR
ncbi:tRNA (adenosine(37)-N6)-threonylcarbamoyltransferase complex transferase subunit TsaD [Candidatus Laterigemmans baculatus]|uniref:tRNA (adenosine(37)-N6)-threonylcarbamoyltransferase complex transferase subunit TsaD n=1 Tax=Candidatus Laterigemmans baculatus TaxID=2770505 RepID=UPI0013DAC92E|nr:tRNA (adenosine(37)-N6)-threonylcarbamoyltransferase complex transferase subunit TsaD [Candidatus Laterigemmans baculatus]